MIDYRLFKKVKYLTGIPNWTWGHTVYAEVHDHIIPIDLPPGSACPFRLLPCIQWHNRWATGGQSAPQRLLEKRGKVENWEERKKDCKREGGQVTKWVEALFSKPLKFVLGLPKGKFSPGKKHFTPRRGKKKSGKMTLPPGFAPSEKFSCYAPACISLSLKLLLLLLQLLLLFLFCFLFCCLFCSSLFCFFASFTFFFFFIKNWDENHNDVLTCRPPDKKEMGKNQQIFV